MFARANILSAFLVSLFVTSACMGQVDIVREYINLELIEPHAATIAIDQLRWKNDQDQAFKGLLERELEVIAVRQGEFQRELEEVQANLPSRLRFATSEVKAQLTGRCIEELLAIQLDLATTSEIHNRTKSDSRIQDRITREAKALSSMRELLNAERADFTEQIDRLTELVQKGAASQSEVTRLKSEKRQVELRMEEVGNQIGRIAEPARDELADMAIRIESLNARKAAAEDFLEEMTAAVSHERKSKRMVDQLTRQDELLEEKKRQIQNKINEIEIRQADTQSFLRLVEERLKQNEAPEAKEDE